MYIALKWLIAMSIAMWAGLCSVDFCLEDSARRMQLPELHELNNIMEPALKNSSILIQKNSLAKPETNINAVQYRSNIFSEYVTFIVGACLVVIYYRKNDFILYTKIKLKRINKCDIRKHLQKVKTFKFAANSVSVAVLKILVQSVDIFKHLKNYLLAKYRQYIKSKSNSLNINLLLLNKLREYGQERKNLGHVLFAAIQENKDIRMRYQLESLAKKRLVSHIENTQKILKDNRSRYVNFQQMYLITHQENNFLKSRIRKLTQDKEDAERSLIKLVNYVWQSKNNELKAYCTRFIVRTKDNLLNSDVRKEIDQFLTQTSRSKPQISDQESKSHYLDVINKVNKKNHKEEDITALVKDAPKLRGLPGECVWTVKDKDGFIEKLYEYETDFDNGRNDTIRRIRQYSVYYDKDCLLDVSSSTTLIQSTNIDLTSLCNQYMNRRISGSQAFQKFLKSNKVFVLSRLPPPPVTPALIY